MTRFSKFRNLSIAVPTSRFVVCLAIFFLAFGVRYLSWQDTRRNVWKVQTVVAIDYMRVAGLINQEGAGAFLRPSSELSALNNLGHPPGYSILISLVSGLFENLDKAMPLLQTALDAFAAVVIFLIVAELLAPSVAMVAGVLVALSPQFAWNSVLLLPDSLSVLPILLAVYCLARARRNPRLLKFILVGALIGISCWLRANAMLLTFFIAGATLLLFEGRQRWQYAAAVVCGTFLLIAPLTIRNAIVYHRFIPISLGAGQTLLEGIADYDSDGRLQIPRTDMGIMKQEAEAFNRPEYAQTLFQPEGVERERLRLSRGFAVIRSHPFWFGGVMIRRATSMLRLERARVTSMDPPVSHSTLVDHGVQPVWKWEPAEMVSSVTKAPQATIDLPSRVMARLSGDGSRYGDQLVSPPLTVRKNLDYVLTFNYQIVRGRMKIRVDAADGRVLASEIVETLEGAPRFDEARLAFIASGDQVRVVISNEASDVPNPSILIGVMELNELGPAANLWTRYPRFVLQAIQRAFITAVFLPLAVIGCGLLVFRRQWPALIIMLAVPIYYFCIQSIVHTEYRYVLPVTYFLFAFAAVPLGWIASLISERLFSRPAVAESAR